MNLQVKRWLIWCARLIVQIGIPLTVIAIQYNIFSKKESFQGFIIFLFLMLTLIAMKGLYSGVIKGLPDKYSYIQQMIQFPILLGAFIALIKCGGIYGPMLINIMSTILIFYIIGVPLTIWYNKVLYDIYGDRIKEFINDGVITSIYNKINKEDK